MMYRSFSTPYQPRPSARAHRADLEAQRPAMHHPRILLFPAALLPSLLCAQGWQPLADVPVELAFPVVVELQGNVHVIGGGSPTGATDLHLRYSPSTDTWDTLALVPFRAQQPCGAVLDGKIHYCAGGYPNTGTPLDDHYVYDPATDTWTAATDLPFPTAINEAASINGLFYVLTGQPDKQLCQSYDPSTGLWTDHFALPDMNFWYGAVLAAGNTIYRFAGGGYMSPTSAAHVYDAVNDDWTPLPPVPNTIHALAGATISDSLICLAGGYYNFMDLDNVWLYHTNTQQYEELDPLPVGRSYHSMVYAGGCVYVVGGDSDLDPGAGTSLIRNCDIGVGVAEAGPADDRPFMTIAGDHTLEIRLNEGAVRTGATAEVLDAGGRRVRSAALSSGSVLLHDGGMAPGIYQVCIRTNGERYVVHWTVR